MTVKTSVTAIRQAQAELVETYLADLALGQLAADQLPVLRKHVQRLAGDFPDLLKRADKLGLFDEVPK